MKQPKLQWLQDPSGINGDQGEGFFGLRNVTIVGFLLFIN
jgi:hypothetical protein